MTTKDRHEQVPPLQPPYLFIAATDRLGTAVDVIGDASAAVVEIALHGPWSPQLENQVSAGLHMCQAGPSTSIIVDLHDLDDSPGDSMPLWLTAWREGRLATAPVQLALSLPATATLSRRLRHLEGPQPSVFDAVSEARAATARRWPSVNRLQARLEPRPVSVRAARELVTQACQLWHFPQLLRDALLIVSELAGNAVQHARTDFTVTVSRYGTRLHVVVHHSVPRFPPLREPVVTNPRGLLDERGRGLRLVHTIAAEWGAMPTLGGKVVWATVA